MNKFISIFILTSSSLIFFASVGLYLSQQTPIGQRAYQETPTPQPTDNVYRDSEGNPKYSEGTCSAPSDCVAAGCSSQICSNDASIITTCELRDDFPTEKTHDCTCVESSCVWVTK